MPVATPLSTSGRFIVDANGARVKLHGVNWAGAHQDAGVPGGLDYRPAADICAQLVSWGFNCVRFPFSESGVIGPQASVVPAASLLSANPDLQGLTVWELYQAMAAKMTAAGLMVIPNKHIIYPGWCCSLKDSQGLWWNANWTNDQYRLCWQTVTQAFAANAMVIGYDLDNEPRQSTINGTVYNPAWDGSFSNVDFAGNYIATGNLIGQYDPGALIFCEGINSGGDLTGVARHPVTLTLPNKVVYSIHDYPQGWAANETQAAYIAAQTASAGYILTQANPAPLWVGEFGVANDTIDALRTPAQGAGTGLGAGPLSRSYGNWWANFTAWAYTQADLDWCMWHVSGTHRQGTEPSTNKLQYAEGDRCWDGLFSQDWSGPASPLVLEALQAMMPAQQGPGVKR